MRMMGTSEARLTSVATKWTLACPCFPVLEVDMSMICAQQTHKNTHTQSANAFRTPPSPAARLSFCCAPERQQADALKKAVRARRGPSSQPLAPQQHAASSSRRRPLAALAKVSRTYLASLSLDDNVSTLAEGRALHGVRERSSGRDRLERLLVLLVVALDHTSDTHQSAIELCFKLDFRRVELGRAGRTDLLCVGRRPAEFWRRIRARRAGRGHTTR